MREPQSMNPVVDFTNLTMLTALLLATSQHWKSSNIADSDHASQDTHGKYGARMVKNSTCHHRRSLSKNPARLAKKLVKLVKCYMMSQDISPPKSHQVAQKPPDPNTDMGPRVAHAHNLICVSNMPKLNFNWICYS